MQRYGATPLYLESKKDKLIEIVECGCQQLEVGNREILAKGYELPVIRGIDCGDLMYSMETIVGSNLVYT